MEIVIGDLVALVDEDDYEKVTKYTWCISNGYAISNKKTSMHHFVLGKPEHGLVVDHINNNKLDNRKENLRFASHKLNSQNKAKKENTSSKYIGVEYKNNKWVARALGVHLEYFTDEIEAAKEYDRYILKNLEGGKTNNLFSDEEIKDIKENYTFKAKKELPRGVSYDKNAKLYVVRLSENKKISHYSSHKNLEDALKTLEIQLEKREKNNQQKILSVPILRNKDGIAIIKTKKGEEILVDDNVYYKLVPFYWYLCNGYAKNTTINYMHRHVFELYGNKLITSMYIDHINRNRLDNRIENLRQVTPGENNHNRGKKESCTSKYRGVSFSSKSNKWVANIQYNKEYICIESFVCENKAALAYNTKAEELYGPNANLNIIETN